MSTTLPPYASRGARALVLLHDQQLREFVAVWKEARAADVVLPTTTDPDYASLETLLVHVLGCARHYMTWCCERLGLPDPGIDPAPDAGHVADAADAYLEHVLDRWRTPLAGASDESLARPDHEARWGNLYCIDAMLEHAVMHPIRHAFQLRELIGG